MSQLIGRMQREHGEATANTAMGDRDNARTGGADRIQGAREEARRLREQLQTQRDHQESMQRTFQQQNEQLTRMNSQPDPEVEHHGLRLWEVTSSNVPPGKRAMLIISSIPNKSKFKNGLGEKFWDKHSAEQVAGEDGLALVKQYLDKELGEKELYKMVSRWEIL